MKKIILALAAALLVITPAYAHDDRYEQRNNDDAVAAGIVGLIFGTVVGSIASDNNGYDRHRSYRYRDNYDNRNYRNYRDRRYEQPRYRENYCVREQMVDNFGRVYHRVICR